MLALYRTCTPPMLAFDAMSSSLRLKPRREPTPSKKAKWPASAMNENRNSTGAVVITRPMFALAPMVA